MMGLKERAFAPLVAVSLEELVPQDHFYRHLQRTLDLSFVHELVRECYATVGRPSIDPVVFFKLQLVLFFEDIRSERLLMRQVADRLSIRWYLGYDLDEPLPDHSSLSKIRLRYGLEVFRRFFEAIVEQCQQAKLVWGKELYFDSTQVNANADLDSLAPRFAVEAREAIKGHLAALFAQGSAPPANAAIYSGDTPLPEQLLANVSCPKPAPLPTVISEAELEELAADNAARHDWIAEEGRPQREVHGLYRRTSDFRISTTDPDATPMRLIPTCVLRDTSKMREVGHRTETFRIGFQLIESVTYLVNHLIERGKSEIRQVFFAQFFPYMFYGIQLWTVGRLSNQSHICRNLEIF